jgi:hypothetical protein
VRLNDVEGVCGTCRLGGGNARHLKAAGLQQQQQQQQQQRRSDS